MSTHPHRRRVWKWLWILAVPLLFSLGGCIASGTYHVQMLMGLRPARPYPLIRYWAEFSSEEFHDDILAVPFFGVPCIVPIGYVGDLLIDTLFFPIDLPLSFFASDPVARCVPLEEGVQRLEVSVPTIPIHCDLSRRQGIVSLEIEVQQGSLEILLDGKEYAPNWITLSPGACTYSFCDGWSNRVKVLSDETISHKRWTLTCYPPASLMPTYFLPALLGGDEAPWVDRVTAFQLCPANLPVKQLSESIYDRDRKVARRYAEVTDYKRLRFVPSEDFVGHVTWEGEPISEVVFTE